jgi:hypothetical protein
MTEYLFGIVRVILACKRIVMGWLEGLVVDTADIKMVEAFDPAGELEHSGQPLTS